MMIAHIITNLDGEPVMALVDKDAAEYISENGTNLSTVVHSVPVFEYEIVTGKQREEDDLK